MESRKYQSSAATYGSLAYDLDALARQRQLEDAGIMPQRRETAPQPLPRQRTHTAVRTRPSALTLGSIALLLAMVGVLMLGYVRLTAVSGQVSDLKSDIARLTDENVSLTTDYERTFDLATIKAVAEANGMSKPTSGQVEYIDLGGEDTAVVYAGADSVARGITASLTGAAHRLWEYFR